MHRIKSNRIALPVESLTVGVDNRHQLIGWDGLWRRARRGGRGWLWLHDVRPSESPLEHRKARGSHGGGCSEADVEGGEGVVKHVARVEVLRQHGGGRAAQRGQASAHIHLDDLKEGERRGKERGIREWMQGNTARRRQCICAGQEEEVED